jgi:hypothetical protein
VQEGEVKARVRQVEAQGIFPIDTARHGIGRLAVREAFDILHDSDQGQAPRCHLDGMTTGGIVIGKELVIPERPELCTADHHSDSLWERPL